MKLPMPLSLAFGIALAIASVFSTAARAASPTAEQALSLVPVQPNVDYDRPSPEEAAKCTITAKKFDGKSGWVVEDARGVPLRVFLDSDGDNKVDQWCYFKDGLEVYRDIDANHNGKADQYRWFNTGGMRWGEDANEDGHIESWKAISAEEASAEVVTALAQRDVNRFMAVVLTPEELRDLGLGRERAEKISARLGKLADDFQRLASSQRAIGNDAQWTHFSALQPGVVPAGTAGSTKDLLAYENASAIVEAGKQSTQVQIGTMVQVGNTWKLIDLPAVGNNEVAAGFFFQPPAVSRATTEGNGPSEAMQKLLAELEEADKAVAAAKTPEEQAKVNLRRADLLQRVAELSTGPERMTWIRQTADSVMGAADQGAFPDAGKWLASFYEKLSKNDSDKDAAAFVKFRQVFLDYTQAMQAPRADFAKIQDQFHKDLEQYIADFPKAPDTAEAMLQLAMAREFAGADDEALKLYTRIAGEFPKASAATKARGAQTRLESVGKLIRLAGKTPNGKSVDLASMRGKPVIVQYWATYSEPSCHDMQSLQDLQKKLGNAFNVLGVNLDTDAKTMAKYLNDTKLNWPQIYEEGGLDSRPANDLGILTVPTMLLVDQQGRVVRRDLQISEVEGELKKLLR